GTDGRRQVGVTLQTDLLYYRARQHPRIGGPVRLVARGAAFKTYGRVLEREWSALVPMAPETARLVGAERLSHRGTRAAVRIVAVDAGHCAFRHPMVKRLLKLRHDVGVARGALLVDGGGLARHQPERGMDWPGAGRRGSVNLVAGRAGHVIFRMAALQTAGVSGLPEMAAEA